jgi:hypothetical protein
MPAFGLAFCFVIDASKTPQRAFPSAATAAPLIGPSQAAWINSFGSGAVCTDEVRDLLQSLVAYIGDPELGVKPPLLAQAAFLTAG